MVAALSFPATETSLSPGRSSRTGSVILFLAEAQYSMAEICRAAAGGRPNFNVLLFRREQPVFYAFDLIAIGGEERRNRRLLERKGRLKRIMPRAANRCSESSRSQRGESICIVPRARTTLKASSQSGASDLTARPGSQRAG
jgi:hypothetical protein